MERNLRAIGAIRVIRGQLILTFLAQLMTADTADDADGKAFAPSAPSA